MSDITAIIAKIQKLRALASSANVNEAANAAAAAEKLIAEYQLTEASLAATDTQHPDEACEVSPNPLFSHEGRRAYWKEWLSKGLAELYGVALDCSWVTVDVEIEHFPYKAKARRVGFVAIGRKSDVELLRYQYAYLASEIERLAKEFLSVNRFAKGEAKTAGNNFRVGAVEGVVMAMREARQGVTATHTASHGSSAAMVLVSRLDDAKALHRRISPEKYRDDGTTKGRRIYSNVNHAAREAGQKAGRGLAAREAKSKLEGGAKRALPE